MMWRILVSYSYSNNGWQSEIDLVLVIKTNEIMSQNWGVLVRTSLINYKTTLQ